MILTSPMLYVYLNAKCNPMNKFLFFMLFSGFTLVCNSQNFLPSGIDRKYHYLVITNPTVKNIEIINFLTENKIFSIDRKKVRFLGVYHKSQAYDFQQSLDYVSKKRYTGFHFLEVDEELKEEDIFIENSCTGIFRKIFELSSGVFFFGGPDIQPGIYGEENTHSVITDPARHIFEVSLCFHMIGGSRDPGFIPFLAGKPHYLVTGFCLGLQTMNVAAGGTLIQDIPFQLYGKTSPSETLEIDRSNLHRNYWQNIVNDKQLMGVSFHTINYTDHPFFRKTVRSRDKFRPVVYSSHHQSPEKTAAGFEITALSPDRKVIEGIAHKQYRNVFAVQFHPEVPALFEDQEAWKFTPEDKPLTYHQIIGRKSVAFHKRYWRHISEAFKESVRQDKRD